ncbi:MAG: tyrosine-type recombinase/integrase [Planctomycetaceae bacterium]|nr:tyrosine-type recombinase/integrase [Planctomycetaceae bacterium]
MLQTDGRSAKTLAKYKQVLEVLKTLCNEHQVRTIAQVDHQVIDAYRAKRVEAGRAPKTVYTETIIIRQLVKFAKRRKLILEDPLSDLQVRKPKRTDQPCWSQAQMVAIAQAATEPARSCFTILRETGMRVGELCHLTWEDVDLVRGFIHIRGKQWTESSPGGLDVIKYWQPKTGDQRDIPMSPDARAALEELPKYGRWVFCMAPTKAYPILDRQMSDRWLLKQVKCIAKSLGLEGHIHTFRHGFISNALSHNIPESTVREWVGHVDPEIIKIYTHVEDEDSSRAMKRLADAAGDRDGDDDDVQPATVAG